MLRNIAIAVIGAMVFTSLLLPADAFSAEQSLDSADASVATEGASEEQQPVDSSPEKAGSGQVAATEDSDAADEASSRGEQDNASTEEKGADEVEKDAPDDSQESDSELPPDPEHMWNDLNGENGIMLLASSPYWNDSYTTFYDGNGKVFASPAMMVIDVSSWQEDIDWDAFHRAYPNAGVIVRLGYGNSTVDRKFARNLDALKRLGIPYGVYLYSYAYDADFGAKEGAFTANTLAQYDVEPTLGIYYDLEAWTWSGHVCPSTPSEYEAIVRQFYQQLVNRGWSENDIHIYSYTGYLRSELNSTYLHARTSWVAQYNSTLSYQIVATGQYGWQYTASASVPGVSGNVDMSAFSAVQGKDLNSLGSKVTDLSEGDYYLLSAITNVTGNGGGVNAVIDIADSGMSSGVSAVLWGLKASQNQQFHVKPNGDGTYSIQAKHSGLLLGASDNGAVQQTNVNDESSRWIIYRDPAGYCYFTPVKYFSQNRVLSVDNNSASTGTSIVLNGASGASGERFRLVAISDYQPQYDGWVTVGGAQYWYDQGVRAQGKSIFDPTVGQWRWIDPDGTVANNKDAYIPDDGGKWVRLDKNGFMVKGEDYRYGGWYYFDPVTAEMAKGVKWVPSNGGKWVYYDVINGQMAHGEKYLNYDAEHTGWYLFDEITGAMYHGDTYVRSNGGKWVRYDHVTGIMVHGLQRYDGSWYYFDTITGAMAHGRAWVPDWGEYHYFDTITGRG